MTSDPTGERRRDWAIGALLCAVTILVVGITSSDVGVVRDEGWHVQEARHYIGWFRDLANAWAHGYLTTPFATDVLDSYWMDNPSHPALVRTVMGATWAVFSRMLHVFPDNLHGFRLGGWLFAGASVWLTYALARQGLSRRAALLAALLWVSLPHAFYHMHLAALDVPVVAAQLWIALGYLLLPSSIAGGVALGLLFGAGLATKHNVVIMPAIFFAHWLVVDVLGRRHDRGVTWPWPLLIAPFAGLAVFVALWPYLWIDSIDRLVGYWRFHLHHEDYPVLWFGRMLTFPPFPLVFPFVMTAITVPLPVLMTFVAGLGMALTKTVRFVRGARAGHPVDPRDERMASLAWFLVLNALVPFLLIALPSTPKFGGTKHWLNGLPFLCILGAWFIEEALAGWRRLPMAAFACVSALLLAPGIATIVRTHPFELTSYSDLIGFERGAANAGMNRTFWGSEARAALPLLNRTAPRGCLVNFGDTNFPTYQTYLDNGMLRADIGWADGLGEACMAVVEPQGEFKALWMTIRGRWNTRTPDAVVHVSGVPLAVIVTRPTHAGPALPWPPSADAYER